VQHIACFDIAVDVGSRGSAACNKAHYIAVLVEAAAPFMQKSIDSGNGGVVQGELL
jgi:hypothetical protein